MINVYDKNIDDNKIKVFISTRNGEPHTTTIGNHAVSKDSGIQFYVEDYVALQLDKMDLYMEGFQPRLKLKKGEELLIPEKTEKEKRIDELKKELEELGNAE